MLTKRKFRRGTQNDVGADVEEADRKRVRWEKDDDTNALSEGITADGSAEVANEKACLAAWCKQGRIGCAFYDPIKCILCVLEDTQESAHFDLTSMLLEQANPDVTLTSSHSDDGFIDTLRNHMEVAGGGFQIRPYKDFLPSKGRDRLLSLKLLSELPQGVYDPNSPDDSSRLKNAYDFSRRSSGPSGDLTVKRWNALIRLSNFASMETSPLCMASIGALLDHLIRERVANGLHDDDIGNLDILDIEIFPIDQVLQINQDALFSLQIFEDERHASIHSDKTKEGLSLFGILNGTVTSLGRSLLRTWLLRPSLSIEIINQRHDAVECFLHSENIVVTRAMQSHLKGIKNMPHALSMLKSGRAKALDWQCLVKFTFNTTMIREALSEVHQAAQANIMAKLTYSLDIPAFKEIGRRINETIDWEESATSGRVCVRAHIDEDLDNRKNVYHGIDSILSCVAEKISQKVPYGYATSLNVVYFPQLGFLICVPMPEGQQIEIGISPVESWSFQFSSDAHAYFKSQEMHDMDMHIGDLYSTIVDREIEIIQGLLDDVLVHERAIAQACHVCAELDCLLSFTEVSRMYEYRRPQMVQENIIDIRRGRHPLHEQIVDTFVPNDARLAGGLGLDVTSRNPGHSENSKANWNSILLCTGANACGKVFPFSLTRYRDTQVRVECIFETDCLDPVHGSGTFVPAESATLGVVDRIFTRLSTRESISKVQSAFMIDLGQVSLALRNCTARSLILLDEFGKGTLSTDGAGLFCGVLNHLLARGAGCPKVLAATHFYDIFSPDLLNPHRAPISFCHMEIMFTAGDGTILSESNVDGDSVDTKSDVRQVGTKEKITYLYRVAKGLSLESHAAKCAEIFGVPSRLVQRAQYVSHLLSTHELCRLLDEDMTEKERLDLEDAEVVCRRFLAWDLEAKQEASAKNMLARCLGRNHGD